MTPSLPGSEPTAGSAVHVTLSGMTDVREQGLQVFRELLPGADVNLRDGKFGDELLEIASTTSSARSGDAKD
jgi:hypothetical protein